MSRYLIAGIVWLVSFSCGAGFTTPQPQVVNVDFNGSFFGDTTHIGADGALSSSGPFWNGVPAPFEADRPAPPLVQAGLLDEFMNPVPVDVSFGPNVSGFDGFTSANDLQDSGVTPQLQMARAAGDGEGGGPGFPTGASIQVRNLLVGELYDLAVYLSGPAQGNNSILVEHAGGGAGAFQGAAPSFVLPGTLNGDYFLFPGLMPLDLGGGEFGFNIVMNFDTYVTGFQVSGLLIPEPGTLALILTGLGVLAWRRSRRR